ncbi:MAG: transcription-repair coupling factor, partial [Desulfovibrionaceae bacterium]|nr:transcription-repair coupling factor [Desulfovibrionaceae bacterium]
AHSPASYSAAGRERLRCYKALSSAANGAAREEAALAMRDRFGPFPEELRNFLAVLDFKQFLTGVQVQRADLHVDSVRLFWAEGQSVVQPERLVALAEATQGARLHPPAGLSLPLPADQSFSEGLNQIRQALEAICNATEGNPASSQPSALSATTATGKPL